MEETKMSQFDETLVRQIKERFHADSRMETAAVTIEAHNGAIFLSGTVPSVTAYEAAEITVWSFQKVVSVRNNLRILFPASFKKPSDSVVRENIRQLFSWDPDLYLEQITISFQDTSIVLSGTVGSFYKKFHAGEIAKRSTSLFTIHNEIAVVPQNNVADKSIAQSIMTSVDQNALANVNDIAVEVENGHVAIRGRAANQISFDAVEDIARYTSGVVDIDNKMVIIDTV
jgi:osmotically-inducible protein OsmY